MAAVTMLRNTALRSLRVSSARFTARCGAPTCLSRTAMPISKRGFSSTPQAFAKKYTQDHEWIEMSEDGESATIGVSEYAAQALGGVVYVELPEADSEFSAGDSIGAVESVKSASDILAPVSGTVIESNAALEDKPGQINDSPEADAWLAKIKVKDVAELEALMDAEAYKAFTEDVSSS